LLDSNPETRMTLTDALRHPWLDAFAPAIASTSTYTPAASQNAVHRDFSELSELSELPENGAELEMGDVSMISAAPSVDGDVPGVDELNITSPSRPRPHIRTRPPLERRSQVLARELAAEVEAAAATSPTTTNDNNKNNKSNRKNGSGGKRARPGSSGRRSAGSSSPDDVAMAEGGESDGAAAVGGVDDDDDGMGQQRRAAKRGRHSRGSESKSSSPPSSSGNGNGTGRSLRSRNRGADGPAGGARR
jgi:hypothetical protein